MVSAQARRDQEDFTVSRGATVRQACALVNVSRSAPRYRSTTPKRDAELAGELQRITSENPTYGYRFAWGMLLKAK